MFSSFPTTRHSVTLEAKDINGGGKDTRGTDFKAYGCYSWKESCYYLGKKEEENDEDDDESSGRRVSNTKKDAEVSSPTRRTKRSDDDEKERRTISTTTTTTKSSLLPVGKVSKSPRSPKDAFDEETYSMRREALFPIDEEINECLRLVTEGDAPWETPNVTAICLAANEDVVSEKQPVGTNKYRRKAGRLPSTRILWSKGTTAGRRRAGRRGRAIAW